MRREWPVASGQWQWFHRVIPFRTGCHAVNSSSNYSKTGLNSLLPTDSCSSYSWWWILLVWYIGFDQLKPTEVDLLIYWSIDLLIYWSPRVHESATWKWQWLFAEMKCWPWTADVDNEYEWKWKWKWKWKWSLMFHGWCSPLTSHD